MDGGEGAAEPGPAPVGVRPVGTASGPVGGGSGGRLRWVSPGALILAFGDRVAVRDGDQEWLGEVVVPPARLLEWPTMGALPVISRRVPDSEWPARPATDGGRLLASLGLSCELLLSEPCA